MPVTVKSLSHIYILGKERQKSGTVGGEDEEDDGDESEEPTQEEKGSKRGLLSDSDSEEEVEEGGENPKAKKSSFEERQSRKVSTTVLRSKISYISGSSSRATAHSQCRRRCALLDSKYWSCYNSSAGSGSGISF